MLELLFYNTPTQFFIPPITSRSFKSLFFFTINTHLQSNGFLPSGKSIISQAGFVS
jgi:hypothetical protein